MHNRRVTRQLFLLKRILVSRRLGRTQDYGLHSISGKPKGCHPARSGFDLTSPEPRS